MFRKYKGELGLALTAFIWGSGFIGVSISLSGGLTPLQILTIRFFIGAILLGVIFFKEIKNNITKEAVIAGSMIGVFLFIAFVFQTIGISYTTASKNAFLTALNVVMVPFIAFIICKKKIGVKGIIGAVMAVVGVGILSLEKNLTLGLGDALTLICAVGFAFQIFFTSIYVKKYRATVLNFIQMLTAFVLSVISMFCFGETQFAVTTKGWISVLYLGVVSTTLCYLLQTACQKHVDETKAAIILSMESVFGTLFSIIILHEQITLRMVIGCVIILAAVIISNLAEVQEET
mgnify:CR=1 FL=1